MKWKFSVGRYAGIAVYVHATFFLLLAWVAFAHWSRGAGLVDVVSALAFIIAIFLCVVLHEYGHALAARAYGITTRDIILLPIGGVARLERMPDKPVQEIYVALAGPAVNLVIAAVLYGYLLLSNSLAPLSSLTVTTGPFLERLMIVNLFLLFFNMIPAFPMDGGRVLRAALAIRGNYVDATQKAAGVGQGIAFLFGLAGLMVGNPMLVFVALFVWIGASQEAGMSKMRSVMGGIPVRQAMMSHFDALESGDPLGKAVELTLAGAQTDFPVVDNGKPIGVLTQKDLMAALKAHGEDGRVDTAMQRSFTTVDDQEMLEVAFERLSGCQCHSLPVLRQGTLVGLLTMDNVGEFVRIQTALNNRRDMHDLPN